MKFLKPIFISLTVIFTGVIIFFFWASSKTVTNKEYQEGYFWQTNKNISEPKETLSIISYNMGFASGLMNNQAIKAPKSIFDNNLKKMNDAFNEVNPDFIAFQEIDIDSNRSYNINQVKEISKATNIRYSVYLSNWNKRYLPFPYWPPSVHYGKVFSGHSLHSKYPINYQKRHNLKQPLDKPYHYNKLSLSRIFQECEVQIGNKKLMIINVHLEPFSTINRMKQAKLLIELYEKHKNKAVIITGDMNSIPPYATKFKDFPNDPDNDDYTGDNTIKILLSKTGLKSVISKKQYEIKPKDSFTYPSGDPTRKIDFILYNDKISPIEARIFKEVGTASDHLPIYFKFSIK